MAAPGFRVVVPTLDRAAAVERAVRSVLDQGPLATEVIVVDDGGADDTAARLESIGDPRVVYRWQANAGASSARNAGAELVSDDAWLTFLDSDDEALPGWLAAFDDAIRAEGSGRVVAVSCGVVMQKPGDDAAPILPRPMGPAFRDLAGPFLAGSYAVRGDAFRAAGGFRPGLRYSENTDFAMRLADVVVERGWTTTAVQQPLVRVHGSGSAAALPPDVRLESVVTMIEHNGHRLARAPRDAAIYRAIASVQAARLGRRAEAARWSWEAWRIWPRDLRHLARAVLLRLGARRSGWRGAPGP